MMRWIQFSEWCAAHANRGQIRMPKHIRAVWSHSKLIVNNVTTPTGPLAGVHDLKISAEAALADAASFDLPWIFGIPQMWLSNSVDETDATLKEHGLFHAFDMTAMECDGALAEPVHPLPVDLEVRRVDSRALAFDVWDLNSRAYDLPAGVTEDILESNTYFTDAHREFGFVVYAKSGLSLSTATAIDLGGTIYVAAVATHPDHRGKGYAELAVRTALSAFSGRPSSLDASAMGEPLYLQMGYKPLFKWHFWVRVQP
jgi:GNAT superfamily N-acetyltransferase